MHERSDPLFTFLQSQDFSRLHYPKAVCGTVGQNCVRFEKAVVHLPRTNVLEVLQILIQPHLETLPLQCCPEGVDNSHTIRSAGLISEKFVRIPLINYTQKVTDKNEKSTSYKHKPYRKHFRL